MQRVVLRNDSAMMPTMAKLVGALGLALTGVMTSQAIVPYMPEGTKMAGLTLVAASFGLLLGWRVIGVAAEAPGRSAAAGLRASFYLAIWGLGFLGAVQMLHKALRMRYDGPGEALADIVTEGAQLGYAALQLDVIGTLFLGGAITAIVAAWAGRRWR